MYTIKQVVEVTQNGTSDTQVEVHITNSDAVVGGKEVYFDQQAYELDLEGNWSVSGAGKIADVSGTTITGAPVSSQMLVQSMLFFSLGRDRL